MSEHRKTPARVWFYWICGITVILLIGAPMARFLVYSNTYYQLDLAADDFAIVTETFDNLEIGSISDSIIVTQNTDEGDILIRKSDDEYTVIVTGNASPEPSEKLRQAFRKAATQLQLEVAEEPIYKTLSLTLDDSPELKDTLDQLLLLTFQPGPNETWTFSWNGLTSMDLPEGIYPVRHGPFDF